MSDSSRGGMEVKYHELGSRRALSQTLLDKRVGKDDFGQFYRQVVLIGRPILRNGWTDGYWWYRYILPYELFGSPVRRPHSQQLAILLRQ